MNRELAAAIDAMPGAYLRCRTLRHAWDPYTVEVDRAGYHVALICARCGSIRTSVYTVRGVRAPLAPRYQHPDGYALRGFGRLDARDAARITAAALATMVKGAAR